MKEQKTTKQILDGARQFIRDFEEKHFNELIVEPRKGFLDIEDCNNISLPESKANALAEKILNLNAEQLKKVVDKITKNLDTGVFLEQVKDGWYDDKPEFKEMLIESFMKKEELNNARKNRRGLR